MYIVFSLFDYIHLLTLNGMHPQSLSFALPFATPLVCVSSLPERQIVALLAHTYASPHNSLTNWHVNFTMSCKNSFDVAPKYSAWLCSHIHVSFDGCVDDMASPPQQLYWASHIMTQFCIW
jgi:hypothetical protein